MTYIAVIDYGMGNLRSVSKALEKVSNRYDIKITSNTNEINAADKIVFPGVGAIKDCIAEIDSLALRESIITASKNKPFLGICLGMQALLDHSAENNGTNCLGIIPGKVEMFDNPLICPISNEKLKVPHMGWNRVSQKQHPLWKGIADNSRFYFVHSYYAQPLNNQHCLGETEYGIKFSAAIGHENIFAVQFHPEKSQHAGLTLLNNFIDWKI